jgi:hypothetical protein
MRLLLLALVLWSALISCSSTVIVRQAQRAFGGWHATHVSTDRVKQIATIVDHSRWIRPLGTAPLDPSVFFSVADGWLIEDMKMLGDGLVWSTTQSEWNTQYLVLITTHTQTVLLNKSLDDLQVPLKSLPLLASAPSVAPWQNYVFVFGQEQADPSSMYVWSLTANNVMQQMPHSYPVMQYNCFAIGTQLLFWTLQSNQIGDAAVLTRYDMNNATHGSTKVTYDLQGSYFYDMVGIDTGKYSGIAYMLATGQNTVYCWNISDYSTNSYSPCATFTIPEHDQADMDVFNSTHLIFVDIDYPGAWLYNFVDQSFSGWMMPDQAALTNPTVIRAVDNSIYVAQYPAPYRINAKTGALMWTYTHSAGSPEGMGMDVDETTNTLYISYMDSQGNGMIDVYNDNNTLLRSMPVATSGALAYESVEGVLWIVSNDETTPSALVLNTTDGSVIRFFNYSLPQQIISDILQIGEKTVLIDSVSNKIVFYYGGDHSLADIDLDDLEPFAIRRLPGDELLYYVGVYNTSSPMRESLVILVSPIGTAIIGFMTIADNYRPGLNIQGIGTRTSDESLFATYSPPEVIFQWPSP